jgi:hypothetical protein
MLAASKPKPFTRGTQCTKSRGSRTAQNSNTGVSTQYSDRFTFDPAAVNPRHPSAEIADSMGRNRTGNTIHRTSHKAALNTSAIALGRTGFRILRVRYEAILNTGCEL